ncbi:MAG: hypothetical protein M1838_004342 [Thelocarpon superellum]|nr:MAG: hypothetical protein M1838_004342 [Thelocarpon superellum]
MASLKYVVSVLAVAGSALAQNGCSADSNTIQSQGDASALSNCATISGDVIIASEVAGTISLDGVQKINGQLNCTNSFGLTSIEADDLTTIGKGFVLNNLTTLSGLIFPQLTEVDSIQWEALPALQNLTFAQSVQQATNVLISNTQLQSLQGIDLMMVENFNINNNPYLTSITTQLSNITTSLTLQANAKSLVASFPDLQTALNMTFRNISGINVPALSTVNGSLVLDDNFFTSFSAPNLTQCGGISVAGNSQLTNISLPSLTTINGGYQIANNTALLSIDGFQNLKVVAGAIDFSGNFTNASLPALADVKGGFNLQTSATFDCDPFQTDSSNGVIKGTYVCAGKQVDPGTAGHPTSSGASPTKSGSANQQNVNAAAVVGLSSFIGGMLQLVL